jgi:hypothetical protein
MRIDNVCRLERLALDFQNALDELGHTSLLEEGNQHFVD